MMGLSVAEASRRAGVGQYQIRRLISEGRLKAIKTPEKRFEVDPVSLEVYIETRNRPKAAA